MTGNGNENPRREESAPPVVAREKVVVFAEGTKTHICGGSGGSGINRTKGKTKNGGGGDETREHLVLSFEKLSVFVPGTKKSRCVPSCFSGGNPLTTFSREHLGLQTLDREPFSALENVSGWLETGQMCLVLGGEQVNKSALLRTLSGRANNKQDEQSGTVLLNGMPLFGIDDDSSDNNDDDDNDNKRTLQGWRRLCPYVSASDNSHSAVMTVRETFEFAARCTSDGTERRAKIDLRVNEMLGVLGLDNVGDTVVGDDGLRGVSGGQKRRVTVGEMAIDRSCRFLFCESITDGLSSTDSLQILQKLRTACKGGRGGRRYGAMISLMQPSDEMVDLFDTILVLTTTGQTAYFGPVDKEALSKVFAKTSSTTTTMTVTTDGSIIENNNSNNDNSLESIADMVQEYRVEPNAKEIEAGFLRNYASSTVGTMAQIRLDQIRSGVAPQTYRYNHELQRILPPTKYSANGFNQFEILLKRRFKLIARNSVTWTRIVIAVVFGVIIGSLFSELDQNILGALGHTGYLFLNCFLVLMLSAAVTIPSMFRDRVTLYKHRSAEFYSGRLAYIAQILTDLPLSLLEGFLLAIVSYFWVNMRPRGFFYFLGTLIGLECVGQALGRLLCAHFRKQVTANAASSVFILMFGTVGGFMPSYGAIHPILRWLSWLTPVSYAFEGLMINQFQDQAFEDSALFSIGNGTSETVLTGGNVWLSAYNLPRSDLATAGNTKMFDLFMLFVFALFYDYIGQMLTERNRSCFFNQTRMPMSKVNESFSMTAPKAVERLVGSDDSIGYDDDNGDGDCDKYNKDNETKEKDWPQSLVVKDLCYDVLLKEKTSCCHKPDIIDHYLDGMRHRLLNKVNARFSRGRMCALMGTSGAGKTTLMDVIAGYKTGGTISGDIFIDGYPKNNAVWKSISGYAEQNDILNPYLTTLETVRFTANCRVRKDKNRDKTVDRILSLMNLDEWRNVVVGREIDGEGLPKHARKRLTIAIQLVFEPKILFLDEPTTGLSQTAARLVIDSMKAATQTLGLITLATIHQPSKHIWDAFDDLLLLVRGGRVTYMGESGVKSNTVLGHFQPLSDVPSAVNCNPADYCLTVLNTLDPKAAVGAFMNSEVSHKLDASIKEDQANARKAPNTSTERVNNIFVEIGLLTVRHAIVQWRNPSYSFMRIMSSLFSSLYIGILFRSDKSVLSGAVFSIGAIFFLVFVLVIPMQAAVIPLIEDRAVLYRETVSGTYSRLSYALGQLLADQLFHLLNTLLMWICFYFLVEFRRSGEEMVYFLLMLYLANWVIQSIGQLFALATPNEESANGLGGLSIILSVILMGFLITVDAMPEGWEWAYWANLFHYALQGLVTNEIGENEYFVEIPKLLPEFDTNATGIVGFAGESVSLASGKQMAGFLSLALSARKGRNPDGNLVDLSDLIDCTLKSGCFNDTIQPAAESFIECYLFDEVLSKPPCADEFGTVIESANFTQTQQCFEESSLLQDFLQSSPTSSGSDDDGEIPVNGTDILIVPSTNAPVENNVFLRPNSRKLQFISQELFVGLLPKFITRLAQGSVFGDADKKKLSTVSCLMSSILPPDGIRSAERSIEEATGMVPVVALIENGGFDLPGEIILSFFGWAVYERGEGFVAPFKWWYCMGAVAIFLCGIEILKLYAIETIVWTNR